MNSQKRIFDAMMALDERACTYKGCEFADTEHLWPYCDDNFIEQVTMESTAYARGVDRAAWRERAVWATALLAVFVGALVYVPTRTVTLTETITVTETVPSQECRDAMAAMQAVITSLDDMLAQRRTQEDALLVLDQSLADGDLSAAQGALGTWGQALGEERSTAEQAALVDLSPVAGCTP